MNNFLTNYSPFLPFFLDLSNMNRYWFTILIPITLSWLYPDFLMVISCQVAREREVEGDVLLSDLGEGIPFRAGAFDGAISIRQITELFVNL